MGSKGSLKARFLTIEDFIQKNSPAGFENDNIHIGLPLRFRFCNMR